MKSSEPSGTSGCPEQSCLEPNPAASEVTPGRDPVVDSPGKPLQVFMVSYLYESRIRKGMGGFQKVFELAAQFQTCHRATLFLPSYCRRQTELNCVWVPSLNLPVLRLISFNVLLVPLLLMRALRGWPDIVYVRIFNSVTPPLLARLLGAKLVVEFNGNPLQFYKNRDLRRGKWLRRLVGWNLASAHRIVALTKGLRTEVKSDFGVDSSKVFVAPSGANPAVFTPRDQSACRSELGVPQDACIAVFAGTFFAYQGVDILLQALADHRLKEVRAWLLGEGIMRERWDKQATELGLKQVWFTGQVEYSRVPAYLGAADFCLAPFVPDRGEVSPLKVVDYLFCARPVVMAAIPPVENLFREFSSILPFRPGDAASLADAMCAMMEQRDDYMERARKDCEVARANYSWEEIARRVEKNCFR